MAKQDRVLPAGLIMDLQVWRAAMQVEPADRRPTGPEQRSLLARTWQHRLNQRLSTNDTPQDQQWAELLAAQLPNLIKDSFLPRLIERLQSLDRAGLDASSPDHPAAALWWRILDELPLQPPDNAEQPSLAIVRGSTSKFRATAISTDAYTSINAHPQATELMGSHTRHARAS